MRRTFPLLPAFLAIAPAMFAGTVYSNLPGALPPNLPSLGYEATSTEEFGGLIQLAGGASSYSLLSATVAMSDWAKLSEWAVNGTTITDAGFYVPFTLNLYSVGAGYSVGGLIGSATTTALIPWRPEADPTCPGGKAYRAASGACYNGLLSTVTFDLTGISAPGQIIFGLSFNTADYGRPKVGKAGPYNSLNFALSETGPTVGSNPLPDAVYWDTSHAGFYTDGGAAGVGIFRQDTGWGDYRGPAIEITATPEPSTLVLIGSTLAGLLLARRRTVQRG